MQATTISAMVLLLLATTSSLLAAEEVVAERTRAEWMDDVTTALRHQATAEDVDQPQAVMDLISLYQQVTRDKNLSTSDRNRLSNKLRMRLLRVSPQLSRDVDIRQARIELMQRRDEAEQQPQQVQQVREDQLVLDRWQQALGQVIGGGAAVGGGGAAGGGLPDHGEELVELIQTVISPESWEVHGGPMSIYYFKSRRVLVISATSEVHHKIGGLAGDLRRAGN